MRGVQLSLFPSVAPERPRKPPPVPLPQRQPPPPSIAIGLPFAWPCKRCDAELPAPGLCARCAVGAAAEAAKAEYAGARLQLVTLIEQGERVWDWLRLAEDDPDEMFEHVLLLASDRSERYQYQLSVFEIERGPARLWGYLKAWQDRHRFVGLPPEVYPERYVEDWTVYVEDDLWDPQPWIVSIPIVLDVEAADRYL